jgi:enoyl-CoA hydratase/carnithine racemase
MLSKVFLDEELTKRTEAFARRIARVPTMAALLIKESVNQSVDAMGFTSALNACFTIHQLNHALVGGVGREDRDRHCRVRYGRLAGGAAAAAGVPVRGVIR